MTHTLRDALDRIAASAERPEAWVEEEDPLRAWLRDPATEALFVKRGDVWFCAAGFGGQTDWEIYWDGDNVHLSLSDYGGGFSGSISPTGEEIEDTWDDEVTEED